MESKYQNIEYDFDSEKIMRMTREEAIALLGEENATIVNEGLKDGTLTYSEFNRICQDKFSIPQQAKLVRNVIFNQLSKTEGFNMFESNKEKQAQYAKIMEWREKAENGELTQDDLKSLCDKVFGENSDMSKKVQDDLISQGKVKQVDTSKENNGQSQIKGRRAENFDVHEKKSWELEPERRSKIQKETARVAQNHQEQPKQASSQELQQGEAQTIKQGQTQAPVQPQQPMMDMGGMEL